MWGSVDKALEQKLSCHMQCESANLQVKNNEHSIINALYYFMCLEMNNEYKLQFLFIHVKICTSRPLDNYCHLSVTKCNYVLCE